MNPIIIRAVLCGLANLVITGFVAKRMAKLEVKDIEEVRKQNDRLFEHHYTSVMLLDRYQQKVTEQYEEIKRKDEAIEEYQRMLAKEPVPCDEND